MFAEETATGLVGRGGPDVLGMSCPLLRARRLAAGTDGSSSQLVGLAWHVHAHVPDPGRGGSSANTPLLVTLLVKLEREALGEQLISNVLTYSSD